MRARRRRDGPPSRGTAASRCTPRLLDPAQYGSQPGSRPTRPPESARRKVPAAYSRCRSGPAWSTTAASLGPWAWHVVDRGGVGPVLTGMFELVGRILELHVLLLELRLRFGFGHDVCDSDELGLGNDLCCGNHLRHSFHLCSDLR